MVGRARLSFRADALLRHFLSVHRHHDVYHGGAVWWKHGGCKQHQDVLQHLPGYLHDGDSGLGVHDQFPERRGPVSEVIMRAQDGYSPAYILFIWIITIVVVMLTYGIFNDFVVNVFYNIGVGSGGDPAIFDLIVTYWQTYFIVGFLLSLIVWGVVNAMHEE